MPDTTPQPNNSEWLEQQLLADKSFQHIVKFAPASQRELMTFELARYFLTHINTIVAERERKHEVEMLRLIEERDSLETRLDSLSDAVASYFHVDIGEHSCMNDPWYNAFELLRDNTVAQLQPKEGENEDT